MCGGGESEGAMKRHVKMATGDVGVELIGGRDEQDDDLN